MALQGTIKDFGLADIFQLIGIQRKTGVLTLGNGEDTVTVKFHEGRVVGADTKSQSVEDLLGAVLVRTGRITQAQLREALRIQKKTLQRLGYVIVKSGFIKVEDLVEALRVQSTQIVYRLFRWRAGDYNFDTADDLEYDEKHFEPINAETILMEGARMIDEWPIIERRIKSDRMILGRTEAAELLDLEVESIVDRDIEFNFELDGKGEVREAESSADGKEVTLSPEERMILGLVDGARSVEEINDRSTLGEFDTYRILADLMTRQLVVEIRRPTAGEAAQRTRRLPERMLQISVTVGLFALSGLGLATLSSNPIPPWRVGQEATTAAQLRSSASRVRLERIETAIEIFYLEAGVFPRELALLARNGYLRPTDLLDSEGREYGYRLSEGGFQLFAFGADGGIDPDLSVYRRFNSAQRLMGRRPEPETP